MRIWYVLETARRFYYGRNGWICDVQRKMWQMGTRLYGERFSETRNHREITAIFKVSELMLEVTSIQRMNECVSHHSLQLYKNIMLHWKIVNECLPV